MENTITITITDNRNGQSYMHPAIDADVSDQLLSAILQHISYQGDGSDAMAKAIDFWIQASKDVLVAQIKAQKMKEANEEIAALGNTIL